MDHFYVELVNLSAQISIHFHYKDKRGKCIQEKYCSLSYIFFSLSKEC